LTPIANIEKIVANITKSVDDNIESSEERQATLTERHKIDANIDSWLPRNIRPLTLVFLMLMMFGMLAMNAYRFITIDPKMYDLVQYLSLAAFSFYFGGRSWEKTIEKKEANRSKAEVIKAKAAAKELKEGGRHQRRKERRLKN